MILAFVCGKPGWAQPAHAGDLIPVSVLGPASAMAKPSLALRGGTLLLSDSPEQFEAADRLPAAMYRDRVTGDFRVFYHHQNMSSKTVSVGVAITNTSSLPEDIFVRGTGESVHGAPDLAGQAAASSFLASRHGARFAMRFLPGATYFNVQRLAKGDTASAILEYILVAVAGEVAADSARGDLIKSLVAWSASDEAGPPNLPAGFSLGSATVSTVAYLGAQPPHPDSLPMLAGDTHIRGTFAHSERFGELHISRAGGLQKLSVDTSAPGGRYSNPMEHEYEVGLDAVDGGKPVYDDGNYGVIYDFHASVDSDGSASTLALLVEPSGGTGHFVVSIEGQQALSPYVTSKSAWWFASRELRGQATGFHLVTTLPGGASGPQDLLFDPGFAGRW